MDIQDVGATSDDVCLALAGKAGAPQCKNQQVGGLVVPIGRTKIRCFSKQLRAIQVKNAAFCKTQQIHFPWKLILVWAFFMARVARPWKRNETFCDVQVVIVFYQNDKKTYPFSEKSMEINKSLAKIWQKSVSVVEVATLVWESLVKIWQGTTDK